ncbi:helix-hairpin-helix domain-containing protein [Cytobacillus sp. IB215665]|uniref:helix-hairpin-helix domain-containing protein n=1 Tax=Cytobacillus sp. IB215665 TaxID=3097357 RepID=UPI002A14148A|nr:helix-hairpin-helix domain-containing protein [Cytobacillus sp. IB215665]MDX8364163.1 helix-hairpin-helix domain-containing protein [Cytobacillus sp. IB215665]
MEFLRKYQQYWFVALIILIIFTGIVVNMITRPDETAMVDSNLQSFLEQQDKPIAESSTEVSHAIYVDIKGAVASEGVYEMAEGSRVMDVIEQAGGVLEFADMSKVNLAQLVYDEMVLYVPKQGEENYDLQHSLIGKEKDKDKVDLNRATMAELESLPGIGVKKAEAILSYREEYGSFQAVEDLLKISGIGEKSLEKLLEYVVVR